MSDELQKQIFAKNLKRLMDISGKNQMDLMNDLDLSSSTVSSWCTGQKFHRMGKIQMLADYFNVMKSDLIEDKSEPPETYYLNDDARDLAQFMFENPEYKVLFDASRKVKKEDIEFVKQMIDRVRGDVDDTGC